MRSFYWFDRLRGGRFRARICGSGAPSCNGGGRCCRVDDASCSLPDFPASRRRCHTVSGQCLQLPQVRFFRAPAEGIKVPGRGAWHEV